MFVSGNKVLLPETKNLFIFLFLLNVYLFEISKKAYWNTSL